MHHTRGFGVGILNYFSLDFLKMLDLALSEIYTLVFHLWKPVALNNAWVRDFRPFILFLYSRILARLAMRQTRVFWYEDPKLCLRGSSKMLV